MIYDSYTLLPSYSFDLVPFLRFIILSCGLDIIQQTGCEKVILSKTHRFIEFGCSEQK